MAKQANDARLLAMTDTTKMNNRDVGMDKPDDNGRTICDLCGVVLQPWSGPDSCQMPHPGCPMFGVGYDAAHEREGK